LLDGRRTAPALPLLSQLPISLRLLPWALRSLSFIVSQLYLISFPYRTFRRLNVHNANDCSNGGNDDDRRAQQRRPASVAVTASAIATTKSVNGDIGRGSLKKHIERERERERERE
jgi:hypothetical protein